MKEQYEQHQSSLHRSPSHSLLLDECVCASLGLKNKFVDGC